MTTKAILTTLLTGLLALGLTSCQEDNSQTPNEPEISGYDLWFPAKGATGKTNSSKFDEYVVIRTDDLTKGTLSIKGQGADISSTDLTPYVVYRDGYYYSVSRAGRFGKFAIDGHTVSVIKEFPITQVQDRRFAHAWLDKSHLILIGSTGEKQAMNWVRIDTDKMKIEAEGQLALQAPAEKQQFNSAGLLGYRKSDNTLLYVYVYEPQTAKRKPLSDRLKGYQVAFIDAKTMEVKKVEHDDRADMIGSTSFGDTRSKHTMMDAEGNFYYIACDLLDEPGYGKTSTTRQHSKVFRIKAGELAIDKSYNGYGTKRGKIIDMTPISKDEVLLYVQDPKQAMDADYTWDSKVNRYVFFWEIMNIRTSEVRLLNGMPYSVGNYGNFGIRVGNKLFLGTNVREGNSCIYIYDLKTNKATRGAEIEGGIEIERIQPVSRK